MKQVKKRNLKKRIEWNKIDRAYKRANSGSPKATFFDFLVKNVLDLINASDRLTWDDQHRWLSINNIVENGKI